MASYDDLTAMIGPLKRAAIDAYMCDNNFLGVTAFRIEGDKYYWVQPNTGGMFGPNIEEVDRPGADGEGGGASKTRIPLAPDIDDADRYVDDFDKIRQRIDAAIHRWTYLPDPDGVSPLLETVRQANRTLAIDAVEAGGSVTGGGEIGGNINLIIEGSNEMAGGMITAFKANFLSQLGKAIGGHHAITLILGSMIAAEQKIWEGARQTVADLVDQSTGAFNAAAEGGDPHWDVVLRVVGYAVSGAAIFASGGTAKAGLAVAGLGLKILDAEIPSSWKKTDPPGGDFEDVMSTFEKVLNDLDAAIDTEEQTLNDNLSDNLGRIHADRSSYDLDRPPIMDIDDDSDLGRPRELKINPIIVKEITGTYLPNIAGQLAIAASHLNDANSLISILRDSSIGIGAWGPCDPYYDMRYLGYELIKNLQVEIIYSAKALQLGVEDIGKQDTGSKDALEKNAEQTAQLKIGAPGGVYDPWN